MAREGERGTRGRAARRIGVVLALAALFAAWLVESRARRELARRYAVLVEGGEASARELELLRAEREPLVLAARAAEALGGVERERYAARIAGAALAIDALAPGRARELLDATAPAERGFEWGALALAAELVAPVVWEHDTRLSALALSPDGKLLATGDEDGVLRLGAATPGAEPVVVTLGPDMIHDLSFRSDGERLAAATDDGVVHVIEVATGKELARLEGHDGPVLAVAFGAPLFSAGLDGSVRAWNVDEGRELYSFEPCAGEIVDLAVNDMHDSVLVASDEGELVLHDTLGHELRHDWSDESVRWQVVAAASAGRALLAGGDGPTARVLDGFEGGLLAELTGLVEPVTGAWLSDAGMQAIVSTRAGKIHLFDVATGLELARLDSGDRAVDRIAVDAQGRKVAFYTSNEERVQLWQRPAPRACSASAASESTATALVADASGARWFTGRADGSVLVLALGESEPLSERRALATTVRAIALAPDATRLAVGGADGAVRLLDSGTLQELRAFDGHAQRVVDLRFTADGARLASASADGVFKLWDAQTGALVNEKPGPRQWVLASALSADGKQGIWVAGGGVVRLWDLASGARAGGFRDLELGLVTAIALTPDARRLVTITNQHRVRVFDVQTGALVGEAPARPDLAVCVTASPDGQRFAVGGVDGAVRLFDVEGALELMRLPGADEQVYTLVFTPDGRSLGASLSGGALEVWGSR